MKKREDRPAGFKVLMQDVQKIMLRTWEPLAMRNCIVKTDILYAITHELELTRRGDIFHGPQELDELLDALLYLIDCGVLS